MNTYGKLTHTVPTFRRCELTSICGENCKYVDLTINDYSRQNNCYWYIFLHGPGGTTGLWGDHLDQTPQLYRGLKVSELPELTPITTHERIKAYLENVVYYVDKGVGIFLYSIPTPSNPLGTGNGKTTTAYIIINEYIRQSVYKHLTEGITYGEVTPKLVSMPKFQTAYNNMYRGSETTTTDSVSYYLDLKHYMLTAPLVVMDDMAVRNCTEAFLNELYEIIDERTVSQLATIYTSNVSIKSLEQIYGHRIVSRIYQSTKPLEVSGEDFRRLNWD